MIIDLLKEEDIDEVVELEEKILLETLGKEMLSNELSNQYMLFLVAKSESKVIGYIGAYIVFDSAELINFVVDEAHQRKGIGQALFDEVLKRSPDVKKITLEVKENNIKGNNFYLKNGFKPVNVRKHYYSDRQNAIIMMKEII